MQDVQSIACSEELKKIPALNIQQKQTNYEFFKSNDIHCSIRTEMELLMEENVIAQTKTELSKADIVQSM